jgi:hypothetical protein
VAIALSEWLMMSDRADSNFNEWLIDCFLLSNTGKRKRRERAPELRERAVNIRIQEARNNFRERERATEDDMHLYSYS